MSRPEPWVVVKRPSDRLAPFHIVDRFGGVVCEIDERENADRIVACVNACAGIPVDALQELTEDSKEMARKFFIRLAGGNPS